MFTTSFLFGLSFWATTCSCAFFTPYGYTLTDIMSVNGSDATGGCPQQCVMQVMGVMVCDCDGSRDIAGVHIDGVVPTLDISQRGTWASQLFTIRTSSSSIILAFRFQSSVALREVELYAFNCRNWEIGPTTINIYNGFTFPNVILTGAAVGSVTLTSDMISCESLTRVSISTPMAIRSPSYFIEFTIPATSRRVYIGEVRFSDQVIVTSMSSVTGSLTTPIPTTTVITATDSLTTVIPTTSISTSPMLTTDSITSPIPTPRSGPNTTQTPTSASSTIIRSTSSQENTTPLQAEDVTTSTITPQSSSSFPAGLVGGLVAAIIIAVILAIVLAALGMWFCFIRGKGRENKEGSYEDTRVGENSHKNEGDEKTYVNVALDYEEPVRQKIDTKVNEACGSFKAAANEEAEYDEPVHAVIATKANEAYGKVSGGMGEQSEGIELGKSLQEKEKVHHITNKWLKNQFVYIRVISKLLS